MRSPTATSLLIISIAALAVSCALLLRKNSLLSQAVHRGTLLAVGSLAPTLTGDDTVGSMRSVQFGGAERRPALVLAYAESCPLCGRIWSRWRGLIERSRSANPKLVFIDVSGRSLTADRTAAAEFGDAVVFRALAPSSALAWDLEYVPDTIVIDPEGKVVLIQAGQLGTGQANALEGLLIRPKFKGDHDEISH